MRCIVGLQTSSLFILLCICLIFSFHTLNNDFYHFFGICKSRGVTFDMQIGDEVL